MQILKGTGIEWRERISISKLYMDWSVKLKLDQGKARSVKTVRTVRQRCCLSPILLDVYSGYFIKESLEEFGPFKRERQVIRTVKDADDLVPLAKEDTVL
jgi:hypothetical protein